MYKFVVIYRRVVEEELLEGFFAETHLQLAEQLPGLIKSEVSRVLRRPGGQSRFHLMYELYFESELALQRALISPVGLALMKALRPWAEERLITWFYADAWSEPAGKGTERPLTDEEE